MVSELKALCMEKLFPFFITLPRDSAGAGDPQVVFLKLFLRWVLPVYEQRDGVLKPNLSLAVSYTSQFSFN